MSLSHKNYFFINLPLEDFFLFSLLVSPSVFFLLEEFFRFSFSVGLSFSFLLGLSFYIYFIFKNLFFLLDEMKLLEMLIIPRKFKFWFGAFSCFIICTLSLDG